jgi:RND superfamily putative drug exporter
VGLAFAVLIDATVVRGLLLPAAMVLLGERCWYLPRRLAGVPVPVPPRERAARPRAQVAGSPAR